MACKHVSAQIHASEDLRERVRRQTLGAEHGLQRRDGQGLEAGTESWRGAVSGKSHVGSGQQCLARTLVLILLEDLTQIARGPSGCCVEAAQVEADSN